jgi:CheY-like chemotaxis protein
MAERILPPNRCHRVITYMSGVYSSVQSRQASSNPQSSKTAIRDERVPSHEDARQELHDEAPAAALRSSDYTPSLRKIRILLADDHKIMRQGLMVLLGCEPDLEVVGEAGDGRASIEMTRSIRPDVVVMDVGMPGMNGVEATKIITSEIPGICVIGLSMYDEASRAAAMIDAGAVAYLNKAGPAEELISTIRSLGRKP